MEVANVCVWLGSMCVCVISKVRCGGRRSRVGVSCWRFVDTHTHTSYIYTYAYIYIHVYIVKWGYRDGGSWTHTHTHTSYIYTYVYIYIHVYIVKWGHHDGGSWKKGGREGREVERRGNETRKEEVCVRSRRGGRGDLGLTTSHIYIHLRGVL